MKKLELEVEFFFGDEVYVKTDPDMALGQISAALVKPGNSILYEVTRDLVISYHNAFELTSEKRLDKNV